MQPSLFQQTLKLALPVALQSVLVSLLGMSDVFMVTGLGSQAVAAIGLGAKLHFVLIMIMASFGAAVSILISQYHGRDNQAATQAILALGNLAGLILLVPIAIAFFVFPQQLLRLLSDDPVLIAFGVDYLKLTVPLLFLTHLIISYESGLRARSETVMPLVLSSIAIVLNIVLNYVLIHGSGPFPLLGVSGVAIASDISRLVQVLLMFLYLRQANHAFSLERLYASARHIGSYLNQYAKTTWPLTVNFTLWGLGTFVYHGVAAKVGTEPLAALSLVSPIEGLYHSLFFGLVTACSVLVGQSLGRDDFDMAQFLAHRFTLFTPLGSMLIGLIILALSPVFWPLLLDTQSPLFQLSNQLLWIMCLTFWVKVLNMTLVVGVLRAGGDSKYVLGAEMLTMWGLGIPVVMAAAFIFELSYAWVYALILVEEVIKALLIGQRMLKKYWLQNLTEESDLNELQGSQIPA